MHLLYTLFPTILPEITEKVVRWIGKTSWGFQIYSINILCQLWAPWHLLEQYTVIVSCFLIIHNCWLYLSMMLTTFPTLHSALDQEGFDQNVKKVSYQVWNKLANSCCHVVGQKTYILSGLHHKKQQYDQ